MAYDVRLLTVPGEQPNAAAVWATSRSSQYRRTGTARQRRERGLEVEAALNTGQRHRGVGRFGGRLDAA